MILSQRTRVQIGDAVLDLNPNAPSGPHPSGREGLQVAAEALGPQKLLAFAEKLRCFAEAASYEASARLEASAQKELAAEIGEVAASSPGMARSVSAGQLAQEAPEQAVAQEIACVRGIARQTAARELARAQLLVNEVPAVLEALAAGQAGPAHARTVVDLAAKIVPADVTAPESDDPAALEEHERALRAAQTECRGRQRGYCDDLLARAIGKTPGQLERYGKRRLERELDEPFSTRHRRARADRYVAVDPDENGMCFLTAYIPTAAAEAIDRRLAEYATAQTTPAPRTNPATQTHPTGQDAPATWGTLPSGGNYDGPAVNDWSLEEDPDEGAEPRTARQIRADAFIDILLSGPEATGLSNVKPLVTVTVPATVLASLERSAAERPATKENGDHGPEGRPDQPHRTASPGAGSGTTRAEDTTAPTMNAIQAGPADLAALAGQAETERLGAFDASELAQLLPQSTTWTRVITDPWTGEITHFDTDAYRPPAALRRALELRDRTCRVPGCGRRASACEPDHVIEYQHGGRTQLENLVSLCKRCHRLKSWGLLTFDLQPDGTLEVETYWGTRRITLPEGPWAAAPDRAKRQLRTMIRARTIRIDTGQPGVDLFKHGPGLTLLSTSPQRSRVPGCEQDAEFDRLVTDMKHRMVEYFRPCPF